MTIQLLRNSINHAPLRRGVLLIALFLTALGPPAAELSRADGGRGGPPNPVNQTFVFSGICAFDIQVTVTGKAGVINLPSGGFLFHAALRFFESPACSCVLITLPASS